MPDSGMGMPSFCIILTEPVTVFGKVNSLRGSPEDLHPGLCQFPGNIKRRLSAKLDDNPFGLFFFVNAQNILNGKRFKIEFIRGIIIGRNGFRIAVDHD